MSDKIKDGVEKLNDVLDQNLKCPMCGGDHFDVSRDFGHLHVQKNLFLSGDNFRSIPTMLVVCSRCGFISLHAVGALGLLDRQ